ncbi:hypothetical protein OG21DRAFT_1601180 [Imleria badia]|nr:hypothetical protein OG21DRAFT_1601180 [Imleria badia]
MAPKPIEDIDFPAISDEILEFLLVVWTFVSDFCLALWSCVTEAFWAAWTYRPFETFRNELAAALIALMDYVVAHPLTSTAIVILLFVVVPGVLNALKICFLHCLGFRRRGVLRGSYAANYQSTSFRGNVRRGSTFAQFQSQRAGGGGRYHVVGGTGSPSWH